MPGLVPGIHVLRSTWLGVDGRDICAKTRFALLPGHDVAEALALMPFRCPAASGERRKVNHT
ncbi:hypothetical protein M2427_005876 [Bradyrhizobium sp. BR13661]|jgi:hypothetical protein|nr:hypothetical protein [Bradyrhizobium sp. BR13661]